MAQNKDDELRRVHDLVLTSLNTAHWIVAAVTKIDSRKKPPDAFVIGGLVEAVLSDHGESPAVTEQFIGVADTSEDIGLPYGFPATSWHYAAGQIVARVFSAIVNPKGYVSGIAGVKRSTKQVEIDEANLKKWWPDVRKQLKPLTTIRFTRLNDQLIQEYCQAANIARNPTSEIWVSAEFQELARPQSRELFRYLKSKPEMRVKRETLLSEFWQEIHVQKDVVRKALDKLSDDLTKFADGSGWRTGRKRQEVWLIKQD